MTPQQDSLSGVIICPAYWEGQRLRVNSVTTTNTSIETMWPPLSRGPSGMGAHQENLDLAKALIFVVYLTACKAVR